jgi:uncharacterized membrane protein
MILVPVIMAVVGVVLLQIGLVLQKSRLHFIFSFRAFLEEKFTINKFFLNRDFYIWFLGTAITIIAAIIGFYAISISAVSLIQPINGFGPIILAVMVSIVYKEKIRIKLWIAIVISCLGVILLAITALNYRLPVTSLSDESLLISTLVLLSILSLFGYLLYSLQLIRIGIFEGIIGGLFGGLPSIYAKIALPQLTDFLNIFHWSIFALIITQLLAFIFLQKGIHKGNFPVVSTIFMSFSISFPLFLAFLLFSETLTMSQIAGIILIFLGACMLCLDELSAEKMSALQMLANRSQS